MPTKITLLADPDSLTAALGVRLAQNAVVETSAEPRAGLACDVLVYRPRRDPRGGPDLARAAAVFDESLGQARRVVLLSSTEIYEPSHENPGLIAEPRLLSPRQKSPLARRWAELEALVTGRVLGKADLLILRSAAVATSDSPDFLCRRLRRPLGFSLPGFDPSIQLLAPADLAEAVALAAEKGPPGVYHVAPAGTVPLRAAIRLAGAWRLPVPGLLQRLTASPDEIALLRYPATVSGAKAERELGFVPRFTSAEAVTTAFRQASVSPAGTAAAPRFDDYGMSASYIQAYGRTLFRFLHDVYWRIEWQGMENVPRQGRAVLTGVHRGFMPWDGVMALHLLGREIGRYPRFLIHPCLVKFPFLANYMTKLGGVLACQENADWVLSRNEILGMFPEGINGAFTMYKDAYKLGKFGRDEYVRMALRNRAPIVPFVTVGSAEIYPILGRLDWKWVKRTTEWLFLPLGPNFPFPGLPLPSKWHTRFLEPIHVEERYGPEAAENPQVVREISREVRSRMEEAIAGMLSKRRSIFHGSVFERTTG
jgi:1-acyl-sn-glycerol-3-phosphate acyltransferase